MFNSFESKLDGDASVVTCKFGNTSLLQFYTYIGTLQQAAAVEIAADAVDLAIASDNAKYNTATTNAGANRINYRFGYSCRRLWPYNYHLR